MSLTSILKSPHHKELKAKIREYFPKPSFNLSGEVKVPSTTGVPSEIGTAFDYLIRFYIERNNPHIVVQKDMLVAEAGLELIENMEARSKEMGGYSSYNAKVLREWFKFGKKSYKGYLETGKVNAGLFLTAILFAKLDVPFRAGVDPNFNDLTNKGLVKIRIKELSALFRLLDSEIFHAEKRVLLNPTFGIASNMVGGADADFIIDGTLVDIKTVKELKLKLSDCDQLAGYYLLSRIGGLDGNLDAEPIDRLGIYFSRFGQLWTISIEEFMLPIGNGLIELKKMWTDHEASQEEIDIETKTLREKVATRAMECQNWVRTYFDQGP